MPDEFERLDRKPVLQVDPKSEVAVSEPEAEVSAEARQRAFEDEYFGEDEVRIDGQVQRGHGSFFARMPQDVKVHYHALEQAVTAEKEVAAAHAALAAAEQKAETAEARVEATAKAVEKWPAKAQA